jgi:phosphoheptose isomerase
MSELEDQVKAGVSLEIHLQEHLALFRTLSALAQPAERSADAVVLALRKGNKLMLCGNGGFAADSQHLAAEFTVRFVKDRRPPAALALSTDRSRRPVRSESGRSVFLAASRGSAWANWQ